MKIEINERILDSLRELLEILDDAANQHATCDDVEELIEQWTPSDSNTMVNCPKLTVGLLRKAQVLKINLKL